MSVPCIKIAGMSDSGKTTLIERLIPGLKRRGWRVAVVKHDPHDHWTWDRPGTDTARHARAGADGVAILSPGRFGLYQATDEELPVAALVEKFDPAPDVVLLEGFKETSHPGFRAEGDQWVDPEGHRFDADEVGRMVQRIESWMKQSP